MSESLSTTFSPTKSDAVRALLATPSPGELSCATWQGMGWPFELWLQFVQLPEAQASRNLSALQSKIRRQLTNGVFALDGAE